jgi:hypothetical protein
MSSTKIILIKYYIYMKYYIQDINTDVLNS